MDSKATGHAVSQVFPKDNIAPVARSLASVITNIFISSTLLWSMIIKHSRDTTIALIVSKALWCLSVHSGNFSLQSFHVSLFSISLCMASFGRNAFRYRTRPRNCLTSFADFGVGQSSILLTFPPSASIPHWETWCPKKSISSQNSFVFLRFTCRPAFLSAFIIVLTFLMCSSTLFDHITISSRYMWQILPMNGLSTLVTCRWWIEGEFHRPIGITHHS